MILLMGCEGGSFSAFRFRDGAGGSPIDAVISLHSYPFILKTVSILAGFLLVTSVLAQIRHHVRRFALAMDVFFRQLTGSFAHLFHPSQQGELESLGS